MTTTLLDMGLSGAGDVWGTILLILGAVILIEAVIMLLFGLNKFGKCLLDSFIVNIVSIVVGVILASLQVNVSVIKNPSDISVILIALLLTILVEGLVLQLLNNKVPAKKVWLVAVVMNVVSYVVLILLANALAIRE